MAFKSLRGELMAWLMIPLGGITLINVWVARNDAYITADLITDRTLLASARVIAEQVKDSDGVIEATIPPSALEMFASEGLDRVIYRITGPNGELLAGYPDVLAPPREPSELEPLRFDGQFRDEPIRAVAVAQPIVLHDGVRNAVVVVGQTLRNRNNLASGLWNASIRDQILLVMAAGILMLYGLHRGLAPLLRLRDEIRTRDPATLEPVPLATVQVELRPLVQALNDAFMRVRQQIATQRSFIANAAHQLRTPLTLLKTQATVGLRETGLADKDEALAGINASADSMGRLTTQLLALARAEQGPILLSRERIDFGPIVRDTLERTAILALQKSIDLAFETDGLPAIVLGHSTLLSELVFNLVDNAIRYTPIGGIVAVSLERRGAIHQLRIEDNGPGIPAEHRDHVFERFYRIDTGVDGAGLGLAIVKEIVAAHNGGVALEERQPAPGLIVVVTLPVLD